MATSLSKGVAKDVLFMTSRDQATAVDIATNGRLLGRKVAADLPGKSIVIDNVRMLRTTLTMETYMVSLLPLSVKA